jgi:Zn-dependent M28 family amino/carboxypeptidase
MAAVLLVFLPSCAPAATPGRAFHGERAYADLEHILAVGPREPGSPASASVRAYIRREVEAAGLTLQELPFVAQTPLETKRGPVNMVNLIAEVKGTRPGIILLSNHYDTKYFPDFQFLGANDGGSTSAWMIEMARALGPARQGRTVWLCWFDGEEAYLDWSETDSLYGSRQMVSWLQETGKFPQVHAAINVDMIGDCKLDIIRDSGAPVWLLGAVLDAAKRRRSHPFSLLEQAIDDDHLPFRRAGVPALNLIDFRYGGSQIEHEMNWHTPRDRIDLVCPESLQTVGDVLLEALPGIDAALDRGDAGRE